MHLNRILTPPNHDTRNELAINTLSEMWRDRVPKSGLPDRANPRIKTKHHPQIGFVSQRCHPKSQPCTTDPHHRTADHHVNVSRNVLDVVKDPCV
jgi:hypothetical protein